MTFRTAVRTCLREKFATFSGRASRAEYWWFLLFYMGVVLGVILLLVGAIVLDSLSNPTFYAWIPPLSIVVGLVYLLLFIPFAAVTVRRFHDMNISGWTYGVILGVALISAIWPISLLLDLIGSVLGIGSTLICIFKGTSGPNKFGPDPLMNTDAEIFE